MVKSEVEPGYKEKSDSSLLLLNPHSNPHSTKFSNRFSHRFLELDILRGIAVVMMIVYHLLYDISFFGKSGYNIYTITVTSGFWLYFARATASIFIFLVGVSLWISYFRITHKPASFIILKYLKRGLFVFALGMAITIVTKFFLPDSYVRFGILHFIGLSIILCIPILLLDKLIPHINFKPDLLALSLLSFAAGYYIMSFRSYSSSAFYAIPSKSWLLWIGIKPVGFSSIDYFPLLPWFGAVLLGLLAGQIFYSNVYSDDATARASKTEGRISGKTEDRKMRFSKFNFFQFQTSKFRNPGVSLLCFLSRHSLIIYLFHQPFLIFFLSVLGMISFPL